MNSDNICKYRRIGGPPCKRECSPGQKMRDVCKADVNKHIEQRKRRYKGNNTLPYDEIIMTLLNFEYNKEKL